MSLLTDPQILAIRSLGIKGMGVVVTITKNVGVVAGDESNPFGAAEPSYQTYTTTVQGWLVARMGRDFEEDGSRIVAVHDFDLRVPVGTDIDSRDKVTISGADYVVMETNIEDTWPEWTVCYIKKLQ
jgi:hypothetical protein